MRAKKENGRITYICKGDLQKEIDKCYKELENKEKDLVLLTAIFDKAKKELDSYKTRIAYLQGFIALCEKEDGLKPTIKGEKMTNLSDRLRHLRVDNGKEKEELAAYLSISVDSYTRYERGSRQPDVDSLVKLAIFMVSAWTTCWVVMSLRCQ